MLPTWCKLLSVLLALSIAGLANACLCAGMISAPVPTSTSHACCKSEQPAPAAPAKDRCADCNLRNRQVTSLPDNQVTLVAPQFAYVLASAPETHESHIVLARVAYDGARDVPIPPLLVDLYHSACLLTV